MSSKLLNKGLEIELFGGNPTGEVLPLSTKLANTWNRISQEPDERNFEYITTPTKDYSELHKEIIEPRIEIRKLLSQFGNLTIIPGSTMPLPFSKEFLPSKPEDNYHKFICKTYGTKVITTSLHINFGIDDQKELFSLLSALQLDVPLLLALSASSPFHDGKVTGFNSFRWHSFPKTPAFVPFFLSHDEFIGWTNKQLESKTMLNVRHHWSSIRPNGPDRPYKLNRIEIRICDLVSDIENTLGIMAFIECILQKYLHTKTWPKVLNTSKNKLDELSRFMNSQEEIVAKDGLDAKIWNWRKDSTSKASEVIQELTNELSSIGKLLNISEHLNKVLSIIENGNEAVKFLNHYNKTKSIASTMQYFIKQFETNDLKYSIVLNK